MNLSTEAILTIFGIVVAIIIGIWQIYLAQKQIVVGQRENAQKEISIVERYYYYRLSLLLDKVKNFWIVGVLEKSLINSYELNLGKEVRYDLIEDPWDNLHRPLLKETIDPKIKISDFFEQNDGAIVILGGAGSGKTTTLLRLAQELITKIEKNKNSKVPVPVIFNLSSWVGQSIDKWLVRELNKRYRIPESLGRRWLEMGWLAPLLDSLDEVAVENRQFCVEAINDFCNDFDLTRVVVCCRLETYMDIPTRLKAGAAICLQSLTNKQINQYIRAICPKDPFLERLLSEDSNILNIAKSPLVLSLLAHSYLSFQGSAKKVRSLSSDINKFRESFFGYYVDRMLQSRHSGNELYSNEDAKKWLRVLAVNMVKQKESLFAPNEIQPDWLLGRNQWWAFILSSHIISGLFSGIFVGLIIGVASGILIGIVIGLFSGLINRLLNKISPDLHILRIHYQDDFEKPLKDIFIISFILWLSFSIAFNFNEIIVKLGIVPLFILLALFIWRTGLAGIQQLSLRIILWYVGYTPWKYNDFLDNATEAMLLRKIGHSYMFIHPLLLDYFANKR